MERAPSPSSHTAPGCPSSLRPIRRHPLIDIVAKAMRTRCAIRSGDRIMLGVSGGADSVALLLACRILSERGRRDTFTITPAVAHVHHHLRADADEDEQFVAELCRTLHVDWTVEHVRPAAHPGSVAANARTLRYQALERRAREVGATAVAVAHHADDQLETMIMALCRGSGVAGLRGMRWRRMLEQGIPLVRPLLGIRRADCEELCRAATVGWRDDVTNLDPSQPRARVRREVIPVLEQLWPDAPRRATAAAEQLKIASELFETVIAGCFGDPSRNRWDRAALRPLPAAMISAGLRRSAIAMKPALKDSLPYRVLDTAAQAVGDDEPKPRRFNWPGGLEVVVTAREVEIEESFRRSRQ